jgi:hypothetical protein
MEVLIFSSPVSPEEQNDENDRWDARRSHQGDALEQCAAAVPGIRSNGSASEVRLAAALLTQVATLDPLPPRLGQWRLET